jgi:hypothetical protein
VFRILLRQVCHPGRAWIACVVVLCSCSLQISAFAASEWSPAVRIAGLQVSDASGDVLRIAVKWRICSSYYTDSQGNLFCLPPIDFNPAGCARLKSPINLSGTNGSIDHFDFQLGLAGRRADKQDHILNQIYAAYATARMVQLSVRDDVCTADGSRITTGIRVFY